MAEVVEFDRFDDLMRLEPHGPDVFVGVSPTYDWGRVYGGQVVAQALKAAVATVEPEFRPHSLHGYFIRGGTSKEPIRFEVDRIRNGRSFITRRVVARQSNGAIFNLSASFHIEEGDLDIEPRVLPPGLVGPDELPEEQVNKLMLRREIPPETIGGRTGVWIKVLGTPSGEQAASQITLSYASDSVPFRAAASVRPDRTPENAHDGTFLGASLDHSLWFHRHGPADEWQLHLLEPMTYNGNRGLAFGAVFDTDGVHLASVAQEIVLRKNRKKTK
ncbi:MAG: acyl-CoA thioesterase domain-containing protein [Acidimicrobiales bacterium]